MDVNDLPESSSRRTIALNKGKRIYIFIYDTYWLCFDMNSCICHANIRYSLLNVNLFKRNRLHDKDDIRCGPCAAGMHATERFSIYLCLLAHIQQQKKKKNKIAYNLFIIATQKRYKSRIGNEKLYKTRPHFKSSQPKNDCSFCDRKKKRSKKKWGKRHTENAYMLFATFRLTNHMFADGHTDGHCGSCPNDKIR